MAEVIWTEPALHNLNEIAEYIALNNSAAAKALVQTVFDKVTRLERHPQSGKIPVELPNFRYRELVINPCRVFYKIEHERVYIIHVMRQEMDMRKFLITSR
ncbi:MAG: type II toxin-antitoxin system RelE/ParE family toxin [Oceanospirillaceae bacterium]|jgi:toxin ParE1/3/4|nr:type II toxin-antitoxin system RelE/ParE family toxin [Oceanospirillaceae bacterium]